MDKDSNDAKNTEVGVGIKIVGDESGNIFFSLCCFIKNRKWNIFVFFRFTYFFFSNCSCHLNIYLLVLVNLNLMKISLFTGNSFNGTMCDARETFELFESPETRKLIFDELKEVI